MFNETHTAFRTQSLLILCKILRSIEDVPMPRAETTEAPGTQRASNLERNKMLEIFRVSKIGNQLLRFARGLLAKASNDRLFTYEKDAQGVTMAVLESYKNKKKAAKQHPRLHV